MLKDGCVIVMACIASYYLRSKLTTQTATIAKETLENENLKIQTQELAMAVVQTILNDKEVNEQVRVRSYLGFVYACIDVYNHMYVAVIGSYLLE